MKFLRKLFGLSKDEEHHEAVSDASIASGSSPLPTEFQASADHLPRKGFSVPVQVPVERSPLPPLLVPCPEGDGGLQGLNWYASRQRIDEDGDVADEFLDEDSPDISTSTEEQNRPSFKMKYIAKHAKVKKQKLLPSGRIQHLVEHHGRLEWV
ncbi:hypothetical protein F511_00943 [Dorcoceras hygrometricum]|uniref:Uncharacterized protein n=1 Tax=Dorcoceras hygrometricum TaxID=472368 RepID=A0A2Z7AEM3_9LAMI|nr:hypothetical protein F511_00943 [Dorcoceras hygrometricum]